MQTEGREYSSVVNGNKRQQKKKKSKQPYVTQLSWVWMFKTCKLQALNSILSSLLHYSHSIFSANDQTELLCGMNWGKLFKRDFN